MTNNALPAWYRPALLLLAVANVVLHLYAATTLEYHRDELLYFSLGFHPDWGYPSVPPLIAWLATGVRWVFGTGVLAVKLVPALASGGFVLLTAGLARELGGGHYARWLAALGVVLMPVMLRTFHLFQPVFLDLGWWTLLAYLTLRYLNTERRGYLYGLGAVLGFALLTKYLVLLFAAGLLLGLFAYRRATFRRPTLYLAGGLALLIFAPNLIWQFVHDFPVVGHMRALNANQLVNVNRLTFLSDQLLMGWAAVVLLLPGLVYLLRRPPYRTLGVAAVFTVVVLLLLRGKSYYTLGLFPVCAAAGAVWWESHLRRRWPRRLLPLGLLLLTLPVLPLGLPVLDRDGLIDYFARLESNFGVAPGRTFEDGTVHALPQDYADQLGWRELTEVVATAYAAEPAPEDVLIYCENYGQAGALTVIGGPRGLPQPVAFNDAFRYWAPETLTREVRVFYYVNDNLGENIAALFADIAVVGRIDDPVAREYGATVYRCSLPRRPFRTFWAEVMATDPDPFD